MVLLVVGRKARGLASCRAGAGGQLRWLRRRVIVPAAGGVVLLLLLLRQRGGNGQLLRQRRRHGQLLLLLVVLLLKPAQLPAELLVFFPEVVVVRLCARRVG